MPILTSNIPPMPIFISGGKATFRTGEKHFYRVFHIFDLIYVIKGTLYIEDAGEKCCLNKGNYIILPPERKHGGYEECKEETIYYWIHFSLANHFNLVNKRELDWSNILLKDSTMNEPAQFQLNIPCFGSLNNQARVEETFEQIIQMNEGNTPSEKMKVQLLFNDLVILLQQEAIDLPSSAQTVANEAVQYIKDNYEVEGFTVKKMAQALLYHPDYLTRSMKKVFGVTPIQYLHNYRLTVAKRRLVEEHIDLSTIAGECGFSDVSYFSRVFKKKEGVTPGEYRRMRRNYEKKDS
ncbi:AraC-like DNA-binding protein [Evansella vedderi]|uniref:AraC-like DNA-binding protein n=1 Tax=Evansella vedderi TaxID=38282 RepID=A0ABU0A3C5_9BACI|nr:helix-turn-helix domain-containing protein [Evansella vedderi]MDQ0258003.1 AraC-like DNA-binding protein [Evansella vedderi]